MSLPTENALPEGETFPAPPSVAWARRVAEHGRTAATIASAASVCVALAAWMVTDRAFFLAPAFFAILCWAHLMVVFGLLVRLIAATGAPWRQPWYRWTGLYVLVANVTMCALFILGAALSAYSVPEGPSRFAIYAFSIAAWGTAGLPFILALPAYSSLWSLTVAKFVRTEEDQRREETERRLIAERDALRELIRDHRALLHRLARSEPDPEHALAHAEALREFDERLNSLDAPEAPETEVSDPRDARTWIDESMCDPEFQPRSLHDER